MKIPFLKTLNERRVVIGLVGIALIALVVFLHGSLKAVDNNTETTVGSPFKCPNDYKTVKEYTDSISQWVNSEKDNNPSLTDGEILAKRADEVSLHGCARSRWLDSTTEDTSTSSSVDNNVSEYIPSWAESYSSHYKIKDDVVGDIVPVSPEKGYATGLKDYPVLTWNNNRIFEKKERISINVEYPHFLGGIQVARLNKYIEIIIQKTIQDDRDELSSMVKDSPDSFESTLDLHIGYHVIGVKNGVVSIEMVITDFTGGGNGNHDWPIVINWDLKTDNLLKTSDLFCSKDYLSIIKPLFAERLLADGKNSPDLDFGVAKPIIETGAEDSSNYEDIMLYKDGIIVVLPPYSILSGAFGIIRVYIPDSSSNHFLCVK